MLMHFINELFNWVYHLMILQKIPSNAKDFFGFQFRKGLALHA